MTRAGDLLNPDAYSWAPEGYADRVRRDVLAELGCQCLNVPQLVMLTGASAEAVKAAIRTLVAEKAITHEGGGWTVMPW